MKRVAVKYDIDKLIKFGFEVYCDGLYQANDLGFLFIHDRNLLTSNENLYYEIILVFKEKNIVKFKLTFYIKDIDCIKFDKKLKPFITSTNGSLVKINANSFDYDCMMFRLHEEGLLEIVEENAYV